MSKFISDQELKTAHSVYTWLDELKVQYPEFVREYKGVKYLKDGYLRESEEHSLGLQSILEFIIDNNLVGKSAEEIEILWRLTNDTNK